MPNVIKYFNNCWRQGYSCFHLQIHTKIHLQLAGETHVVDYKYVNPFLGFPASILTTDSDHWADFLVFQFQNFYTEQLIWHLCPQLPLARILKKRGWQQVSVNLQVSSYKPNSFLIDIPVWIFSFCSWKLYIHFWPPMFPLCKYQMNIVEGA